MVTTGLYSIVRLLLQAIVVIILTAGEQVVAEEKIAPLGSDQVVMLVSPSGPGSSIDTMARTYGSIASRYTTQKFVYENRAGAAGFIATNFVLEQPANGYVLQAFTRATTLNFLTQPHAASPLDKYYYVGTTMFTPVIIYTYKGGPYADARQLIAEAKARPAAQVWGGASAGGTEWLMVNLIWQKLGAKGRYAAFKDGGALRLAVLGKHLPIGSGDMSDIIGYGDTLVPLVIGAEKRLVDLPNVPTFRELGYDLVEGNYRGVVARRDIPPAAKIFHERVYDAVMSDPAWAAYLKDTKAEKFEVKGAAMEKIAKESSQRAIFFMKEAGYMK
jgi:tripartite-type tricarboxylate transporter receptor subunit TctC